MNDEPDLSTLPPGMALAWGHAPTGRRGPKPAFSVAEIVRAAMALADEDGFAALSMPRIARRLEVTANALYRYVDSKEELLVLLADAGWGGPPVLTGTWRECATAWVHAELDRLRAHPWLLDLPVSGVPVTPNLLRWMESLLAGLSGTGLGVLDRLGCVLLLDGYAHHTARLAHNLDRHRMSPVQSKAAARFLGSALSAEDFPEFSSALAEGIFEGGGLTDEDVAFGLRRILDGIQAGAATPESARSTGSPPET